MPNGGSPGDTHLGALGEETMEDSSPVCSRCGCCLPLSESRIVAHMRRGPHQELFDCPKCDKPLTQNDAEHLDAVERLIAEARLQLNGLPIVLIQSIYCNTAGKPCCRYVRGDQPECERALREANLTEDAFEQLKKEDFKDLRLVRVLAVEPEPEVEPGIYIATLAESQALSGLLRLRMQCSKSMIQKNMPIAAIKHKRPDLIRSPTLPHQIHMQKLKLQ